MHPVALVPVFNHPHRLADVVAGLRRLGLPVVLVDDGSEPGTAAVIDGLRNEHVLVERLPENRGKGAAVIAGLRVARARGWTHAVQVDADGQHDLDAIPALLQAAHEEPHALVSGAPVYDASIPKSRLHGRRITHFWTAIETLSMDIRDAMCGFRVYPVEETLAIADSEHVGARMDFDTEIMVRLYWRGVRSVFVPVKVVYPPDGISHFRMVADNLRITRMHVRLCLGMLWRLPRLLRARRKRSASWARLPERGSLWAMRIVARLTRLMGRLPATLLTHPVTCYFWLTHPAARRASRQYLERVRARTASAPGQERKLGSYRHFLAFTKAVVEKLHAWQAPERLPPAKVEGADLLEACRSNGRGMLLLSAHLGNLEMCRALALHEPGLRVNALVYTKNAAKFSAFMNEINPAFHDRVILVEEIGADTAIRLRELIDRGEIVVTVADRTPASENGRVVEAPFLGADAPFAIGPYLLAHLLECPVGLMFCLRDDGGGYRVVVEPFADRIHLPRGKRLPAIGELASRFAARLEYHALRHPLQWFNFYDFWAPARKFSNGKSHATHATR